MLVLSPLRAGSEPLIDLAPHGRNTEEILSKGHHVHALQIRGRLHEQDHVIDELLDLARTDASTGQAGNTLEASGDGRYGFFCLEL
jgi:hypothetical protein